MADIDTNIAAYEAMQADLETKHLSKWVLIHDAKLVGVFDSSEDAAAEAIKNFGGGPYLIRQVGAPPVTLSASVMYNPGHGGDKMRV